MRIDHRVDLTKVKLEAISEIDRQAEEVRALFITTGAGQAMVYGEKRREAETYMANTDTPLSELPHIEQEAALNGITPFEQAVEYINMSHIWGQASAQIEAMRLQAKRLITDARNLREIKDVFIDWTPVTSLKTQRKTTI